jgi:hypothetical protein
MAVEPIDHAKIKHRPSRAQIQAIHRQMAARSAAIAGLSDPAMASLLPLLQQARRESNRALADWLSRHPDGAERFTARHYRDVVRSLGPAIDAYQSMSPAMRDALVKTGHVAAHMAARDVVTEVATLSEALEGLRRQLPIDVAKVIASGDSYLIPRFANSARRYAGAVGQDIRRMLAIGVIKGESVSQMTDRLQGSKRYRKAVSGDIAAEGIAGNLDDRYRFWAMRVVRTETQSAYNTQLDNTIRQAKQHIPDLIRRWDASLDRRTCIVCGALHGTTAPIGGAFPDGTTEAPQHPNCVPAGTMISTPDGPRPIESIRIGDYVLGGLTGLPRMVTDVHVNYHQGDMVVLEADGCRLDLTPNHPVLTGRGWVEAGEIQASDFLFRHFMDSGVLETDAVARPSLNGPPAIPKVLISHDINSHLPGGLVPLAGIDLDIQTDVGKREVQHVDAHSILCNRLQSCGCEGNREDAFQSGEPLVAGSTFSTSHLAGHASLGASDSIMGSHGQAHTPVLALSGHAYVVGFGCVPRRDAEPLHSVVDGRATAPHHAGHHQDGLLFVEMESPEFVGIEWDSSGHTASVAIGPLKTITVCSFSRRHFNGAVYNISVDDDESYVANGIVAHNCRCRVGAWRAEWSDVMREAGISD